jgi:hypothetical protein
MRSAITAAALLLSASLVFSQEEKIAFRTLALAQTKFPELWAIEGGKPLAITFSSAQPSVPFKADKASPLPIFKGPLDDKGMPKETVPIKVAVPAASSILLIGWMEGDKPGFLAIADSFSTMKSDDWLVINPSKKDIAVQIGADTKPTAVKANSHLAMKNTAPSGTGAAVTIAAKQDDGKWKSVYTSFWPIYDNQRGMIVVIQKGEKLNVNYIADQITPPAPPPKP